MPDYPESNLCPSCNGTGLDSSEFCYPCMGSGYVSTTGMSRFFKVFYDSATPPINVFHSYKILECLDATEHNALTDTQKDGVLHLLACGRVDLNDGKAGKVRLWNWFGAESTTVANLTALLT